MMIKIDDFISCPSKQNKTKSQDTKKILETEYFDRASFSEDCHSSCRTGARFRSIAGLKRIVQIVCLTALLFIETFSKSPLAYSSAARRGSPFLRTASITSGQRGSLPRLSQRSLLRNSVMMASIAAGESSWLIEAWKWSQMFGLWGFYELFSFRNSSLV